MDVEVESVLFNIIVRTFETLARPRVGSSPEW